MKSIRRKLFRLFTGELAAAIMFVVIWGMYAKEGTYVTTFPFLYAFLLLEIILLQGSYYWFLKWRQTKRLDFSYLPDRKLRLFGWFKKLNLFLIVAGVMVLISQFSFTAGFLGVVLLYVFAVVEHVNYYHIRLSYMNTAEIKEFLRQKGFRPSRLAKELDQKKEGHGV